MTSVPNNDGDHTLLAPPTAFPNSLAPGTRLGEFEITSVLGQGGFGIVYLAQDHSLGRDVALKEYMPAAFAGRLGNTQVTMLSEHYAETFQVGLHSFVNEAQLLAKFDHPSLVKVYRFWEANGTGYMAMPFYAAPTLKQLLKQDQTALAQEAWLKNFLDQILDALQVLHDKQCYHRDIAPDNILMLDNARPLLLDFGAARRVIGDMTQALTVILKPGYAPIEQYGDMTNVSQGPWTDLYALASVVYFIVTGKVPPAALSRLVSDSMVPLSQCAADRYSRAFIRAIDAALGVRPEQRPQSVAEFRAMLELEQAPASAAASVVPEAAATPTTLRSQILPAAAPDADADMTTLHTGRAPATQRGATPAAATPATPAPQQRGRPPKTLLLAGGGGLLLALAIGAWLWSSSEAVPDAPLASNAAAPTPSVVAAPAPVAAAPACPLLLPDGTPACPVMVAIKGGSYTMGAAADDPAAAPSELGATPAQVAPFEISAHLVTVGLWELCVTDGACPKIKSEPGDADNSRAAATLPITNVSWDASHNFIAWLSSKTGKTYRLPTELEWEYAARAGSGTVFPWGDKIGKDNAQCGQCGSHLGIRGPAPVGSFAAYGGLYDMVGNAYEWVEDCWTASHAAAAPAPDSNDCKKRVQKGGAFDSTESDVRPTARTFGNRTSADARVGFRISR